MARRDVKDSGSDLPDLSGRTYVVTGSTRGLGYFSVEKLTRAGAHVIMTGRNPNRLQAAHNAINRRVPGASAESLLLDTSNLGSVRAAAATLRDIPRLDGLLLNAGIVHPPRGRTTTADGNEVVFATNTLGHFALAGELLIGLAKTRGRVVWVGSMSTFAGSREPVDPQLRTTYTPVRAYVQSKVEAASLGFEADRRLRAADVPVASVVAHPGYSTSGRTRGIRGVNEPTRRKRFVDNLQAVISHSKEAGADSLVHALAGEDVQSGQFWGPRFVTYGAPRRVRPPELLTDPEVGGRIWTFCESTARVTWPFDKAARAGRAR